MAFLPPGSPRDGRTAVVELAATTRRDNLATFPGFRTLAEVPTSGISVGLGTIVAARSLRLVLHGADKRHAARRLLSLDRFDPDVAGEHRARPRRRNHLHRRGGSRVTITLDALARESGTFLMVAMDQRESLRTMLAPPSPATPTTRA